MRNVFLTDIINKKMRKANEKEKEKGKLLGPKIH